MDFRNYTDITKQAIKINYANARKNQTVDYVKRMHTKYLTFRRKLKVKTVLQKLEDFVDISDPDTSLPNYYHAIQTAEAIRKDGYPEWFQLVGLIHDIGKIMYTRGCDEDGTSLDQQWGIVGDTFITGCKIPDTIVYPEFNKDNPDFTHRVYKNKYGIYTPNCGLDSTICSWGHDEYLYQVLIQNIHHLPEEALYIIRFHSLYLYHYNNEYEHLTNEKDKIMLYWLKRFNKYDLYTKTDTNMIVTDETTDYYNKLINKYIPNGELWF
jgi:inositol oxygenase